MQSALNLHLKVKLQLICMSRKFFPDVLLGYTFRHHNYASWAPFSSKSPLVIASLSIMLFCGPLLGHLLSPFARTIHRYNSFSETLYIPIALSVYFQTKHSAQGLFVSLWHRELPNSETFFRSPSAFHSTYHSVTNERKFN